MAESLKELWGAVVRAAQKYTILGDEGPQRLEVAGMGAIPYEYSRRQEQRGSIYAPPRAIDPFGGGGMKAVSRLVKNPSRVLDLFRRFARTESPSDAAVHFGYAFRKSPQMRETLEKARKMSYKAWEEAPKGTQARADYSYVTQFLREAGEEARGASPKGFSFLEKRAVRRASAEQRKLYESGVRFLPD